MPKTLRIPRVMMMVMGIVTAATPATWRGKRSMVTPITARTAMRSSLRKTKIDCWTAAGISATLWSLTSRGRVGATFVIALSTWRPNSTMLFPSCISRERIKHLFPSLSM